MSYDPDTVIHARHLAKAFPLYTDHGARVKQSLFGGFKTFSKPFWALRDIDLEVRRGDTIGILGRNGCGKTTLLQIICGMTRPTKGEIWVRGRVAPVLALGATFDQEATGRQNVLIAGAVMGLKRAEVIAKFDSIEEFAGIGAFMDQPLKHYSTGMRTRLAFAICAHVEADILIVDEALSVGDAAFQRKCLDWIDQFKKTGTLLFVSHAMDQVRRLCSHTIWIDKGRIRDQGEPHQVIRSYLQATRSEQDDVRRFSAVE